MMCMCVQKPEKTIFFLVFIVFLSGCGPMDTLLPSAGTYKVNLQINGASLNECSFINSGDTIRPFFEESVSNDPDISELVMFLRNSRNIIVGWRVIYRLTLNTEEIPEDTEADPADISDEDEDDTVLADNDGGEDDILPVSEMAAEEQLPVNYRNGDELIILVHNFHDLPVFPIPGDLPIGRYTLVSQVMSGRDILQRTERTFFYLPNTDFLFKGINIHLPGISDNNLIIPRGTVVMLEADVDFNKNYDPYIVWYNGKRKIAEGSFSDGARRIFWTAPDESGFYSLSAEIFPVGNMQDLTGYQKEISILVSSKTVDFNLVPEESNHLVQWYIFESNLNDYRVSAAQAGTHSDNAPVWMHSNGTYGIVTGIDNTIIFPEISFSDNRTGSWQILFRFMPFHEGIIFSVLFDNARLNLSIMGANLVLSLVSGSNTVTQSIGLPVIQTDEEGNQLDEYIWMSENTFFSAALDFSVTPESLTARVISGNLGAVDADSITMETEIVSGFYITLGAGVKDSELSDNAADAKPVIADPFSNNLHTPVPEHIVLWDELAVFDSSAADFSAYIYSPAANEEDSPDSGKGL